MTVSMLQRRQRSVRSDLDVLPKVPHASVILLISNPFRAIDGDQTGELHAAHGLLGKILDLLDILLTDLLALLAIVYVVPRDSRSDREEDEPVARW